MQKIWFTSDLHFGHKNILRHCNKRIDAFGLNSVIDKAEMIKKHDEFLITLWNNNVGRNDIVYILGDFSFRNSEETKKLLSRLNGKKFLILGNHDKSSEKLNEYFVQITQMKEIIFKKNNFDFLKEDFGVFCCHYPMVTWSRKHYGVVNLHGHCHGKTDDYNNNSLDLRVDVGIDSELAKYGLVSLEQLYTFFKKKTDGELFSDYVSRIRQENKIVI